VPPVRLLEKKKLNLPRLIAFNCPTFCGYSAQVNKLSGSLVYYSNDMLRWLVESYNLERYRQMLFFDV